MYENNHTLSPLEYCYNEHTQLVLPTNHAMMLLRTRNALVMTIIYHFQQNYNYYYLHESKVGIFTQTHS